MTKIGLLASGMLMAACGTPSPAPASTAKSTAAPAAPTAPVAAPTKPAQPAASEAPKPTSVTAAGAPKSGPAPEITVWSSNSGPNQQFWEKAVAAFNERQSAARVKIEFPFAGSQSLVEEMQKARLALQSRSAGDVIHTNAVGRQIEEYQKTNQLMKLTDAYRQFNWEQRILKPVQELLRVGPDFYALPESIEVVGYFYDKELYQKAGSQPPKTIQEMLDHGAKLKEAGIPMKAVGVRAGWPAAFYASAYMYASAGSRYREALEGKASWLDPKMEQGLSTLKEIVDRGFTNPDPLALNANQEIELFFQQKVAAIMRTDGFVGQVKTTKPAWEVGFFPLPLIDPSSDVKIYGGVGGSWVVPTFTKAPEAALAFLEYAFSEEVATSFATGGHGFIPVPIKLPADADPLIKDLDRVIQDNAAQGIGHFPVAFLAPGTFAKLHGFVQGLLGGQLAPRGVLDEMEQAMKTAG